MSGEVEQKRERYANNDIANKLNNICSSRDGEYGEQPLYGLLRVSIKRSKGNSGRVKTILTL